MPKRIIAELSPEQEATLPSYRDKWQAIAMLTERSDRNKVTAVIF